MSISVVFDPPQPSDSPAVFNVKAFEALADWNDWAVQANQLAADVNADKLSAAASELAAAGSAGVSSTKAGEALASKVAAELAETNAEAAQAAAALSQSAAAGSATTANTAKLDAQAARDKAQQWADAALNVPVEAGQYSAKHWAQQAQATVTGQLVYRGGHDASTGAYPASPFKGDYWKIAVGGTVSGVALAAGNQVETKAIFIANYTLGIAQKVKSTFVQPNIDNQLAYMEAELDKNKWFAGNEFSAADIQMSFPLEAAASRAGLDARLPKLTAFLQRIHARPAYQRALERGGPYDYAK